MRASRTATTFGIVMLTMVACSPRSISQMTDTSTPPGTGTPAASEAGPNPVGSTALLDDFSSYVPGHVDEVTGGVWTSHSYLGKPTAGYTQIATEPNGNKFGQIGGGDTDPHDAYGIRRLLKAVIPDSSTATTLYLRVMTEQAITNGSFGLSDVAKPFNYDSFKIQIRFLDGWISLRNGTEFTGNLYEIEPRSWYNVWAVINNSTDSYDLYATANGDATGLKPLATNVKFRVPVTANGSVVAGDLVSFWGFSSHRKVGVPSNRIRVDDIAIMDGVNLTVPR